MSLCACGCRRQTKFDRQGLPRTFCKGHHFRKSGPLFIPENRGYLTACHIWTGYLDDDGYPLGWHAGKTCRILRVIYEHQYGSIPEGLVLDHLCRQRDCIAVGHVELVTNKENVRRGLLAILTVEAVAYIKSRPSERGADLAREFGVSPQTICDIRKGRKWGDVEPCGHRQGQGRLPKGAKA